MRFGGIVRHDNRMITGAKRIVFVGKRAIGPHWQCPQVGLDGSLIIEFVVKFLSRIGRWIPSDILESPNFGLDGLSLGLSRCDCVEQGTR
ncbi:MAG: hypothetical protein V3T19_01525 [Acidiferrobacterales bacterium]